jgi:hypothetical protein
MELNVKGNLVFFQCDRLVGRMVYRRSIVASDESPVAKQLLCLSPTVATL